MANRQESPDSKWVLIARKQVLNDCICIVSLDMHMSHHACTPKGGRQSIRNETFTFRVQFNFRSKDKWHSK